MDKFYIPGSTATFDNPLAAILVAAQSKGMDVVFKPTGAIVMSDSQFWGIPPCLRFLGIQKISEVIAQVPETVPVPRHAFIRIIQAAMGTQKIECIKFVRAALGWGLKESKDFVESADVRDYGSLT